MSFGSTDAARVHVVGDVHGHLTPLLAALAEAGLVDAAGDWSGGGARLWFLGDFVDRGPDGIGVVDLVMRLAEQAAEVGGEVNSVLGNHELLLLGAWHFPGVYLAPTPRTFDQLWRINGGQLADLHKLTERHLEWLSGLPAVALVADHLLLHADTAAYLELGGSLAEVNASISRRLTKPEPDDWGDCVRWLSRRGDFQTPAQVDRVLAALGGRRIVHGHSPIPAVQGIVPAGVAGPHVYGDGRVVNVDGGLYGGGPCLVLELEPVSGQAG